MGSQFTASSPQPLNTSPDESELTTPAHPSLCPNTTQKHLRHPYTLGSLCQAKLFSHLLSVTSDCRPVRFSRRNVKAAWSERAGRISYLTWIIFNWHRSLSRQGPHSAPVAQKKTKRETERNMKICPERSRKRLCERRGMVGSDWTWVSCSEHQLDGDEEEVVTGRERGKRREGKAEVGGSEKEKKQAEWKSTEKWGHTSTNSSSARKKTKITYTLWQHLIFL